MIARRVAIALLVGAVVAVAAVLATDGEDPYTVRLRLQNAGGLRDGAQVSRGGVVIGRVDLRLDERRDVVADLRIDREHAPVPRDATVAIAAVNLLGQKRLELLGGHGPPAPSGFVLPARQVQTATDLDQVLDVLDPDTRARLAILINEAGAALSGRRKDLAHLLQHLPPTLASGAELLRALADDRRELGRAVERGERLLTSLAGRREDAVRAIRALGDGAGTLTERRAQLRATLARAPGTLRTLQRFLGDLRETTVPLAPAAAALRRSAPPLEQLLAQLRPFRAAATPALRRATAVAPTLTELAREGTPVVREALPTVASLDALAAELPPVGRTLDRSADNVLAVVENWSRAVQLRDGMSHLFRGEAAWSPNLITSVLDRLSPTTPAATRGSRTADRRAAASAARRAHAGRRPASPPAEPRQPSPSGTQPAPAGRAERPADQAARSSGPAAAVDDLLDLLLRP